MTKPKAIFAVFKNGKNFEVRYDGKSVKNVKKLMKILTDEAAGLERMLDEMKERKE